MAEIKGIDNLSIQDVSNEISNGGRFVIFTYTISLLVVSFKRTSDIYLIKSDGFPIAKGWPFFLISMILGWWGIPWGPIYTFQSMYYAFAGKNVTDEVMSSLAAAPQPTASYNTGYGINSEGSSDPYQMNNR